MSASEPSESGAATPVDGAEAKDAKAKKARVVVARRTARGAVRTAKTKPKGKGKNDEDAWESDGAKDGDDGGAAKPRKAKKDRPASALSAESPDRADENGDENGDGNADGSPTDDEEVALAMFREQEAALRQRAMLQQQQQQAYAQQQQAYAMQQQNFVYQQQPAYQQRAGQPAARLVLSGPAHSINAGGRQQQSQQGRRNSEDDYSDEDMGSEEDGSAPPRMHSRYPGGPSGMSGPPRPGMMMGRPGPPRPGMGMPGMPMTRPGMPGQPMMRPGMRPGFAQRPPNYPIPRPPSDKPVPAPPDPTPALRAELAAAQSALDNTTQLLLEQKRTTEKMVNDVKAKADAAAAAFNLTIETLRTNVETMKRDYEAEKARRKEFEKVQNEAQAMVAAEKKRADQAQADLDALIKDTTLAAGSHLAREKDLRISLAETESRAKDAEAKLRQAEAEAEREKAQVKFLADEIAKLTNGGAVPRQPSAAVGTPTVGVAGMAVGGMAVVGTPSSDPIMQKKIADQDMVIAALRDKITKDGEWIRKLEGELSQFKTRKGHGIGSMLGMGSDDPEPDKVRVLENELLRTRVELGAKDKENKGLQNKLREANDVVMSLKREMEGVRSELVQYQAWYAQQNRYYGQQGGYAAAGPMVSPPMAQPPVQQMPMQQQQMPMQMQYGQQQYGQQQQVSPQSYMPQQMQQQPQQQQQLQHQQFQQQQMQRQQLQQQQQQQMPQQMQPLRTDYQYQQQPQPSTQTLYSPQSQTSFTPQASLGIMASLTPLERVPLPSRHTPRSESAASGSPAPAPAPLPAVGEAAPPSPIVPAPIETKQVSPSAYAPLSPGIVEPAVAAVAESIGEPQVEEGGNLFAGLADEPTAAGAEAEGETTD